MAFYQILQGFNICIDQSLFLFVAQALELPLASDGRSFRVEDLRIHEINWTILERVCGTTARIVRLDTRIEIPCRSDIETIIGAAKDIDKVFAPPILQFLIPLDRLSRQAEEPVRERLYRESN